MERRYRMQSIFSPHTEEYFPIPLRCVLPSGSRGAADPSWNLLELHTREFAVTFLSYSNFDFDPHPVLAEATKINLNTGSIVRTDYPTHANPPILHRKETFLPPDDPRIPEGETDGNKKTRALELLNL